MRQDLFKVNLISLEQLRAAPTIEAAGEMWADVVAQSLNDLFKSPKLRDLVIAMGRDVAPFFIDPFIDDAYDLVTGSIVKVIDKIDGEVDVH